MGLEIPASLQGSSTRESRPAETQARKTDSERAIPAETKPQLDFDIAETLANLEKLITRFNRRFEFSVDRQINRIIVKVIDRETDKVIKEIPPEEIQRLLAGLHDLMGLLVDEEI